MKPSDRVIIKDLDAKPPRFHASGRYVEWPDGTGWQVYTQCGRSWANHLGHEFGSVLRLDQAERVAEPCKVCFPATPGGES